MCSHCHPTPSLCAMLAGRAQGSCSYFSLPSISFLSQILETQAVQFPSSCTNILPTPLKNTTIPLHLHSKRRSTPAHQGVRVQEVQWEAEKHSALDRKASSWASPPKRASSSSHMCSRWFPTAQLKHSGAMASAHSAAELKWRWISNAPVTNVHCAPTHSGTSQEKKKNKTHTTMSKWMKTISRYFWSPDLEFASRALY